MAETVKSAVAVVGIDIGKNSFHVVRQIGAARLCCARGGRVAQVSIAC